MLHTSCNGSLQYSKQEFCAIHLYLTAPFFDACVYVMIYLSIGMNEALWCKGIRNTNTWNLTRWNVEDTVNPTQYFLTRIIFVNIPSFLLDTHMCVCQLMSKKKFIVGPFLNIILYFAFLTNILVTLPKSFFYRINQNKQIKRFIFAPIYYDMLK